MDKIKNTEDLIDIECNLKLLITEFNNITIEDINLETFTAKPILNKEHITKVIDIKKAIKNNNTLF